MTARDRLAWFVAGFLAVCSVGAEGCGSTPQRPVEPTPSGGAGPVAGAGSLYPSEATCLHLRALGCPEAADVVVCSRQIDLILAIGPRADIDLGCLDRALSKAEVRACQSVVCGGAP